MGDIPKLQVRDPWPPLEVVDLAAQWRRSAFEPIQFGNTGAHAPEGERGGMWVMSAAFPGRCAYMKPRKGVPGTLTAIAAREKIAADLAHDLGVHVPAAILTERSVEVVGQERQVVLSVRLYPSQMEWAAVRLRMMGRLGSAGHLDIAALAKKAAPRDAARAFAFDLWLSQLDHGENNPSNIVFASEADGSNPAFLFFDYEKSMGFLDGKWLELRGNFPFPKLLRELMSKDEARETARTIASMPDNTVMDVVGRVPERFISSADREQILHHLLTRKQDLPSAVDHHLSGVQ
jgi:hypothetical protein